MKNLRGALSRGVIWLLALGAPVLAGCGGGTRVVVTVGAAPGQTFTGITVLDVTATHGGVTRAAVVPEVGGEQTIELPATFGLRIDGATEAGTIVVCAVARDGSAPGARGCSPEVTLTIGGRTEVALLLDVTSCGNGIAEAGEACDGDDLGASTCADVDPCRPMGLPACTVVCELDGSACYAGAECGDGLVGEEEQCDGTELGGAECASLGFDSGTLACTCGCLYDTSGCTGGCGNGAIDAGEVCDGALVGALTCETLGLGFDGGALGCALGCSALDTSGCTRCGNMLLEAGEACDGLDLGGETCLTIPGMFAGGTLACDASCAHDTAGCFLCGDGVLNGLESCDGSDLGGQACDTIAQGWIGGPLACTGTCTYDTAACTAPVNCGNATIDPGEDCDGALVGGATCLSLGFEGGGTLGCYGGCLFDTTGCIECGDGVGAGAEDCDGPDLRGGTCDSLGLGFDGGTLACGPACTYDTAGCTACGDGVRAGAEICDGADLGTTSCLGLGFDGGTLACDSACALDVAGCSTCGDGVREGAELCDGVDLGAQSCTTLGLGFAGGTLGCMAGCTYDTSGCMLPADCGNGAIGTDEDCEPGLLGGATCVTQGWGAGSLSCTAACAFDESGCYSCGDGALSALEACDGANLAGETCVSLGHDGGTLSCAASCLALDESACSDCGDGMVESPEGCDGGNFGGATCVSLGHGAGALACTTGCALNTSGCYTCGNLVRETAETCDGSALGGATCASLGFVGGMLGCSAGCLSFNTSGCTNCGNGLINGAESCDGANLAGATCTSLGFAGGTLSCSPSCTFVTSACMAPVLCGDGSIGAGEECEGANLGGGTCSSATGGLLPTGMLACDAACQHDTTGCSSCGNGGMEGAEACDGTDLDGQTCFSATGGALPSGTLSCNAGCTLNTGQCSACGNGNAEGGELCDGADLNGATCTSAFPGVYSGGTLGCGGTCAAYNTMGCFGAPSVPLPRKPINGAYTGTHLLTGATGNRRPTFTWDPSTVGGGTAITYELQYDTSPVFTTATVLAGLTAPTHTPASDLVVSTAPPVGSRYHWRVRAFAGGIPSAWSAVRTVNVGRLRSDVNGDGYSDVVVGAPDLMPRAMLYGGSTFGPGAIPLLSYFCTGSAANCGTGVATCDLNADGFADVIVGDDEADLSFTDAGRVNVYFGGASPNAVEDAFMDGEAAGDRFGAEVDCAGDVDGDGFQDLVVGAAYNDAAGTPDAGRAYLYRGGPGAFDPIADAILTGDIGDDRFGRDVAGARDLNGDGFHDVAISIRNDDSATPGEVRIYFGGPGVFNTTVDVTFIGPAGPDSEIVGVTSAGDVNGDGYSDLLISDDGDGVERADILLGGAPMNGVSDAVLNDGEIDGQLGYGVASGDFNRDGYDDVAVGEVEYGVCQGRAFFYFGGPGVFNDAPDGTALGATTNDWFGKSIGTGDYNGDGYIDAVVGAPSFGATGCGLAGPGEGAVYMFYGGPGTTMNVTFDWMEDSASGVGFLGDAFGFAGARDRLPDVPVAAVSRPRRWREPWRRPLDRSAPPARG